MIEDEVETNTNIPPKERDRLLSLLYDSHSHLHEDTYKIFPFLSTIIKVKRVCLCSAIPGEWDLVFKLSTQFPSKTIPCFGVHPWNALRVQPTDQTWQIQLRQYLSNCPNAILGEVGVDKLKKESFKSGHQQLVFEAQVEIAIQLNKPMNVHCVQAHGWLFDFFRKYSQDKTKTLPPVLFHSYTGSADMVIGLIKMPKVGKMFYFSFSSVINLQNSSKKLESAVAVVPENRLLLESDWNACQYQENGMWEILTYVANVRNWTPEETANITTKNAEVFFGIQ